jgi:hypothetical protein
MFDEYSYDCAVAYAINGGILHLGNREIFLLTLPVIINDMKRFYKKVFKNTSLGSKHGPGQASSTSTLITSTTDLMPPVPACDSDATVSAQVIAGVSVSVQLRSSHL